MQNDTEMMSSSLLTRLSNNRVIPAAILLSGQAGQYTRDLVQMHSKQDMVTDAFINMRNTANQQWKMMEIGVQNVLIVLGLQLLPVLQNIYHAMYLVANQLLQWLESTGGMDALKQALLGISIVVGSILLPAMIRLVGSLLLMSVPMDIIIAAGILLGKVLQAHPEIIQRVETAFMNLWRHVQAALPVVLAIVKGALTDLKNAFQSALASPAVKGALQALQEALQHVGPILRIVATIAGVVLVVAFRVLVAAIGPAVSVMAFLVTVAAKIVSALATVVQWIASNEVAFTAFKAILAAVAILMLNMAVNAVAAMIAGFIEMIPYLLLQIAMWYGMAAAVIAATWPFVLAGLAIAALVFGIMELVQHWSQVKAFFANIASAVGSFFSWLGGHVHSALNVVGGFFQAAFDKIGQIIDWFTTLTPQKIGYGIGYALGFLVMLPVRGVALVGMFVEKAAHLVGTLVGQIPSLLWRLLTLVFGLLLQLFNVAGQIVQTGVAAIIAAFTWLVTQGPQQFAKMIWFILDSLGHFKDQAWAAIKKVTAAIWAELQKLPDQAAHLIWAFEQGLVNAIKSGAQWVITAIKNLAGGMIDGFKHALGIHSPSTVMYAHGVSVVQGLVNGFRSINVGAEWLRHTAALTQPITASLGVAGEGRLPGGVGGGGFRIPQGGGTVTHNWTLNFPNAKHGPEIKQAILDAQQETYRRSRRPGGYGSFGSDYTTDS